MRRKGHNKFKAVLQSASLTQTPKKALKGARGKNKSFSPESEGVSRASGDIVQPKERINRKNRFLQLLWIIIPEGEKNIRFAKTFRLFQCFLVIFFLIYLSEKYIIYGGINSGRNENFGSI